MKNREKYREEILSWGKNSEPYYDPYCEFAKKNMLPRYTDCANGECAGTTCTWCRAVFAFWLDEEYTEPPKPEVDWTKVPVDTLVRVRDNKNDKWALRYFCEWKENGAYMTFPNGRTSKTAKYYTKEIWKYCELVEDEDGSN